MAGTESFQKLKPEKQQRILHSCEEEFAREGYDRASVNRIVRNADISKGSLFQYFRSKGDLFTYLVESAVSVVRGRLREVREQTEHHSIHKRLAAVVDEGFSFVDDHPYLARIYFRLLHSGDSPFGSDKLTALHRQSTHFLEGLLEEAVQKGEIRQDSDLRKVAFLLHAWLQQVLHAYSRRDADSGLGLYRASGAARDEWRDAMVDLFCNGIVHTQKHSEIE